MEMRLAAAFIACILGPASCATMANDVGRITEVYVADFHSDDIEHCRPSDVDLSHGQAREFFMRARRVDLKTLHDHYDYAPCYIEGTLKYGSRSCDWEIRAGATGQITCGKVTEYFACDDCDDLFASEAAP